MIFNKIEANLIRDIIHFAQNEVLTPREYGLLKKDTSDNLLRAIQRININPVLDLTTREQYDQWFDTIVSDLHDQVFPIYRENLMLSENNPYSYTARLLSKYIKFLTFHTQIFMLDMERYFYTQHPIISSRFLETFPDIGISRVTQIKDKQGYYEVVNYYRSLIDRNYVTDEISPLLELDFAIEV